MDDLDEQRSSRDAALDILETLERHGLVSDGPCVWQSDRTELYSRARENLRSRGKVFECTCSRKQIAGAATYPGTCREAGIAPGPDRSTRFIATDTRIRIEDQVQGHFSENLAHKCGDFVIYRRDGAAAYHLATVVDDADMGITRVVRGADLLASTPRQVALCQALGLHIPEFAHIPVLLDAQGRKVSKRLSSTPVDALNELQVKCNLLWCFEFLGLPTPRLGSHLAKSLLHWAAKRFRIGAVPRVPVRSDFVCL